MKNYENKKKGVIWISGYSAAGKTTVGRRLESFLRDGGSRVVFLDGDNLRSIFGKKWGYDRSDRVELSRAYFRLASYLCAQDLVVVIAAVSMYDDVRNWVKDNIPGTLQVFLNVPEDERMRRDDASGKNVYQKVGDVSQMYDPPTADTLIIDNFGIAPEKTAQKILQAFNELSIGKVDFGRQSHWGNFYSNGTAPRMPSGFAIHVGNEIQGHAKILEIGCGNGRDSEYFSKLGHKVVGIDPSKVAIDFCNNLGLPVRFFNGTLDTLDDEHSNKFDVAYSRFVIHAMPLTEEIALYENLKRILKPGGNFYIECRSINDPMAREGEVISPTERIHGHYRRFIELGELIERLTNAGFTIEESIESNGLAVFKDDDPVVIRIKAIFGEATHTNRRRHK